MKIELQKIEDMENTFGGWTAGRGTIYQVVFTHNSNAVIVPYPDSKFPDDELALFDWLVRFHYSDDSDLSLYIDHLANLPDEERKIEIGGNSYYSKHLNPILDRHFGG